MPSVDAHGVIKKEKKVSKVYKIDKADEDVFVMK